MKKPCLKQLLPDFCLVMFLLLTTPVQLHCGEWEDGLPHPPFYATVTMNPDQALSGADSLTIFSISIVLDSTMITEQDYLRKYKLGSTWNIGYSWYPYTIVSSNLSEHEVFYLSDLPLNFSITVRMGESGPTPIIIIPIYGYKTEHEIQGNGQKSSNMTCQYMEILCANQSTIERWKRLDKELFKREWKYN